MLAYHERFLLLFVYSIRYCVDCGRDSLPMPPLDLTPSDPFRSLARRN